MTENITTGLIKIYLDEEKEVKTTLKEEYFICDGKKEGLNKLYWSDGQLLSKVNYIDGKMNGIYESYWRDGQLLSKVNYIDGKMDGIYESYYYDGQLREKVNYVNGVEQ